MENKIHKVINPMPNNTLNLKYKTKVNKNQYLTIEERIEKFKECPENEKESIEPCDWGKDQGKESFIKIFAQQ